MSKNLNSFILSDRVIEIMKQKLKKTEEIHKELGFNLCQIEGSNELQDDTHCIGSECKITLAKTCSVGTKVGLFHTHPGNGTGTSDPSISDLHNAYYYGISCIGGVEDKRIRCDVRKDKTINAKDLKTFKYYSEQFGPLDRQHKITSQKGYETLKAKFREMYYVREKLRTNYFNTIDII